LDKANAVTLRNIQETGKGSYIISPNIKKAENNLKKQLVSDLEREKMMKFASVDWYRITGYQAVPGQTDSTPHLAAWNDNIVGAMNVAAVVQDSRFRRGDCVKIDGLEEVYIVLDHFNKKYNGQKKIDVLVNTKKEAHRITGKRKIHILPRGSCALKRMVNGKIREEKFSKRGRFKL